MSAFFPRTTGVFHLQEPGAFRRFTRMLGPMAIVTGVVMRIVRAIALSLGSATSIWWLASTWVLGTMFLCGMVTLHLGNYTLRRWVRRAPIFYGIEAAAEVVMSAGLIAVGFERKGSQPARWGDWPLIVSDTFFWRGLTIMLYAAVLGGVVWLVRRTMARRQHAVIPDSADSSVTDE